MLDHDIRRKTYLDEAKQQYMHVALCHAAFRLPDKKTTLVITRLHNAVTVNPDRDPVYCLLPRREGGCLLTDTLHMNAAQVDLYLPFEHDAAARTAPGEW